MKLVNTPFGDSKLTPVSIKCFLGIIKVPAVFSLLGKYTQVALPVSGPEVDVGYPPPVQLQDFVLAKVEGLPYQNGTNLSNT